MSLFPGRRATHSFILLDSEDEDEDKDITVY